MSRISTGTVSVDAGGTVVTLWQGDGGVFLSNITAPAGSQIVIEGVANFIKTRLSTTSVELELPHAGAGGENLPCAISALTGAETSVGTLNARTATVIQQLSALDANGRGLFYNLIGVTGDNDPGPGKLAFNNADPELVTEIYLDILDANEGGRDVSGLLGLWASGTILIVRSLDTNAYASYMLTAAPTVSAGYRKCLVSYVEHDGDLAAEPVAVEYNRSGFDGIVTAFARTLLDDADAAAFYGTLGQIPNAQVRNDLTADKAFRRGNAIGTVSQSVGVPTGAIIERGSNANGEYVRFADGTQICTRNVTFDLSNASTFQAFVYPAAWAAGSTPAGALSFNSSASSGSDATWWNNVGMVGVYTTISQWSLLFRGTAAATTGQVRITAIGRWF